MRASMNGQQAGNASVRHRSVNMHSPAEEAQLTLLSQVQPMLEGTQNKREKTQLVGRTKIV